MSFHDRNWYYDIDGRPMTLMAWGRYVDQVRKDGSFQIAITEFNVIVPEIRRIWISTVYIGLDMSFLDYGPPLIFETMIFGFVEGEELEAWQVRTHSKLAAQATHDQAVMLVKEALGLPVDHC